MTDRRRDIENAVKLCGSLDPDLRRIGAEKLYSLYKLGVQEAGWELVEWHKNEGMQTKLTNAEAVELLITDVEKNLNPLAALSLYYHYFDLVGIEKIRSMLELVKDNSVEAEEILSGMH